MPAITCPVCRELLTREPKTWRCQNGHSFDVAREGYVNLLLAQQKNSLAPGDSAESLAARRAFLDAGHYQPMRDAVIDLLAPLHAQTLLDIGCGEGYYTGEFTRAVPDVTGLDIAKPAIQLAAKRHRHITWLVGTGATLPLQDASADIVSNLFTQLHVREMQRVLKPGGHVLVVSPAAAHLWSLREALFGEVHAHEPEKFIASFGDEWALTEQREVRFPLPLSGDALGQLLMMTPYVWKARPERRAALEALSHFSTEAAFSLLLFRKPD